jgi:hypothetical protein
VNIVELSADSTWWSSVDRWALSAVAIGVVMEGIVYWLPKKRRETRLIEALTRTGWFILVVALIVEFLAQHNKDSADALIIAALTDRASQAELALAKIKEPRRLLPKQLTDLTSKAKMFSDVSFDFSLQDDPEQIDLAVQLATALSAADWHWVHNQRGNVLFRVEGHTVGITAFTGLQIDIGQSRLPTWGAAIGMLRDTLKTDGIDATATYDDDETKTLPNAIHIMIGKKPL